ncbi:beta strand repeat-containing protein [Candidatus Spyradosoma sp. SGI.093]|uniref:beta strand repeat-containing protein n=1 Tax=Candidatus Spyradosoma sp. SGI.093 TaxID=3420583 RepID=UPI003D02FE5C
MNTSKLLITSLLAAAAMSVPAWAETTVGDTTYSGSIYTWANTASSEADLAFGAWQATTWDSATSSYSYGSSITSWNNIKNIIASSSTSADLNTIRFDASVGSNPNMCFTFNPLAVAGIIVEEGASDYVIYAQGRTNTASKDRAVYIGNGNSTAAFSTFHENFKISFGTTPTYSSGTTENATKFFIRGTQTWTIDAGKTFTLDTGTNVHATNFSGTTTITGGGAANFSGAGTISMADGSAINVSGGSTLILGKSVALASDATSASISVDTGSTLDLSAGSLTVAANVTAASGAVLELGAVTADSAALSATGNVTLSERTIFRIDSYVAGAQLISSSGTLTAAGVTSGDVSGMGVANLYIGGYLVNQRGSAAFSVSESGVLTLDSYEEGANYSLTWNGGASGVWKVGGSGWTTTDTTGEVTFQNGDSVTFGTDTDNNVTLAENLKVGTMTVSAATSLTGTGTVRVDAANLTTNAVLTLGENVVLDLGNISEATTKTISGKGTVKVATGSNFEGVSLGAGFAGTIEHTGNIDANTFAGNQNAKYVLSSGSMWGGANLINISNDIHFAADYTIGAPAFTVVNFTGALTQAAGTTLTIANSGTTATFSGTANLSQVTLSAGTLTISGKLAVAGKISVCKGGTVTQSAGTVSATRLVLNDSVDQTASFYTLTGGVFNITGTEKTGGVTGQSTTANAVLIGHWKNGTSKLTVSGGTLNVTEGFTVISWDSAGTLEVSGGTANLYGVSLNTYRANAANVTLSSGRLNLGAGGLTYGSGTNGTTNKTVTLSGGTLGALTDWSSDVAMSLSGNVTIDTTKQVVGADGASANAEGNVGASITLAGALSGDGASLTKTGAGTLTLSNANIYTGGTVIEAGTVVAAHANALGTTKGVEVKSGATLNLGTSAVTVFGLSGAGTVGLAEGTTSSTLTVTGGGVFSGRLNRGENSLALVFDAGGQTLELNPTMPNSLSSVEIKAGTVKTGDAFGLGGSRVSVQSAGALEFTASKTNDYGLAAWGGITFAAGSSFVVDVTGAAENDVLAIITSSVIRYNNGTQDVSLTPDNLDSFVNGFVRLEGWDGLADWSYDGTALSVTLTIPEPSVFGLLAGLGALALAGTRRRRRKA